MSQVHICQISPRRLTTVAGMAVLALLQFVAGLGLPMTPEPAVGGELPAFQSPGTAAPLAERVDTGLLFVNGKFLGGPYVIEAGEQGVTANGIALGSSGFEGKFAHPASEDRPGRWDAPDAAGFAPTAAALHAAPRRWLGRAGSRAHAPGAVRSARRLVQSLRNGEIVVVFEELPWRTFATDLEVGTLCRALVEQPRSAASVSKCAQLAWDSASRRRWQAWLVDFAPSPGLLKILQQRIDELEQLNMTVPSHRELLTPRLSGLAYPLTLAGMLLSVISFGHVLQWSARGMHTCGQCAFDARRYVVIALGLMLGMSLVDLLWTLLADHAGVMTEINPLGAQLLHTPWQLALFKLAATIVSCSILFAWRHQPQIQQATWWMCLVCVLVMFRWIVFDSMVN